MTYDDLDRFCASLPCSFCAVQWGGAHVWKVGDQAAPKTAKVFAVAGWDQADGAADGPRVSFKTSDILFEVLSDHPACRPAPYLASRGLRWIQCFDTAAIDAAELSDHLAASHRLASLNLTKRLQRQLGLNQPAATT